MTLVDIHGVPMKSSLARSTAALPAQGMTASTAFGPGAPMYPADGISRMPRGFEYPTGFNVAARPRSNAGRMSFYAMKSLIDNYDIAQIAIRHRMNSLSSYDWSLVPMEGWDGDLTAEIAWVKKILRKPDGENLFRPWLRKYLKSVLRYDAGCLYRLRLNSGRAYGLKVINGETIAPLIDGWGDRPTGDAPAYVQFVNGASWNWLLDSDIIYQPMHPDDDSPYGSPAIEGVVTAANTDLRLQLFLMQTFTENNIPAGFGIAPDSWTPDQVIDFQEAFDAFASGSPEMNTQIRFVPGGLALQFPTLDAFNGANAAEAKWLMWKTAAMFSVTPDDLGFTETSNRSVGESQADVSSKVGDVPLAQHIQEILTDFIQNDLGIPLEFQFDLGREEEDRLATAKSDDIYIKNGTVSSSEIREMRFGKTDNATEIVPRFIFNPAGGALPVSALLGASPQVDAETALPHEGVVQGAIPLPAAPAVTHALGAATAEAPTSIQKSIELLRKEATAGVTAATGFTGNPLKSGTEDAVEEDPGAEEMAKFAKFAKSRRRLGKWRDFNFETLDTVAAHRLNVTGRAEFRKAAGETVAAGVAVLAEDTGRVLMLQRAFDPADPASGRWEFPGGCLEADESSFEAAEREWCEETGLTLTGTLAANWMSPSSVYQGFVVTVPTEFDVSDRIVGSNPDDPDGDSFEALAWWLPALLVNNPAVRTELEADISLVLAAVNGALAPEVTIEKGPYLEQAVEDNGLGILAELPDPEADASPLVKGWRDTSPLTEAHKYDLMITDHYGPAITEALRTWVDQVPITSIMESANATLTKVTADEVDTIADAVRAQVAAAGEQIGTDDLEQIIRQVIADGYLSGGHSAAVQLGGHAVSIPGVTGDAIVTTDWATWVPGDAAAALKTADGGLSQLLEQAGISVKGIKQSALDRIGNGIADGLRQGWPADKVARTLRGDDAAGSVSRADIIAHTETARAQTGAAFDAYRANAIDQWDLLLSDGACEECVAVADANPHPVGDDNDAPPVHPYCRCASAPVLPVGGLAAPDTATSVSEE